MPRKITNQYGLPEIIAQAIRNRHYSKGDADFSATELQKPPLLRRLELQYEDDIEEDVVDMVWSLFGDAVHYVVAQGAETELAEYRWSAEIEVDGTTFKLSGQADSLDLKENKLDDWKTTKVWAVKDGLKSDWIAQVNVYRWILAMCGIEVDTLNIGCFFKDWSHREKQRYGSDYPPAPVWLYPVPVWNLTDTEEYIRAKIREHQVPVPRDCTDEERWKRIDKYTLMKKGRKSAVKVEDSEDDLYAYIKDKDIEISSKTKYYLEVRPGAYVRCTEGSTEGRTWCSVSAWCPLLHPDMLKPGEEHNKVEI